MKKVKTLIILFVSIIIVIGIGFLFFDSKDEKTFDQCNTIEEKVNYQMEHLTLDEKIAQMLIVYYSSSEFDNNFKSVLETNKPGGFILFQDNITNYENTLKFVNSIKSTSTIPMFISIDQEGGAVQRFKSVDDAEVMQIPSMLSLGKTNDTELAYDTGKVIAEELKTIGVNMDFAPVMDVIDSENNAVIGARSFGTDKNVVAKMGIAVAKGLNDNGVIPVYKHFPGHGSTIDDSHYFLPTVSKSKEELLENDLIPFKEAIANGAEVIMIGHLAIPQITGDKTPASLSKILITDLLKKELNYKGLVITDALNMKAITDNYKEQEIYEMAINAGVDILLMPRSSSSAIELIKDSINSGRLTIEQIDTSVKKILTLKYKKLEEDNLLDKSVLGSDEHKSIIDRIKE